MIEFFTGEWILTRFHFANSGAVVAARALLTTIWIFGLALTLTVAIDPGLEWPSSFEFVRQLVAERVHWFGAIFAASYAGFYARFASQWTYLANLYNEIKKIEAADDTLDKDAMAQWKAGFIEDAQDLHLSTKLMFAGVIAHWSKDPAVVQMFEKHTVGGQERLRKLLLRVHIAVAKAELKHR